MGWLTLTLSAVTEGCKAFYAVFTRNNAPDMVAAKNASNDQKLEEAATKQEQSEEQSDKPIITK